MTSSCENTYDGIKELKRLSQENWARVVEKVANGEMKAPNLKSRFKLIPILFSDSDRKKAFHNLSEFRTRTQENRNKSDRKRNRT